MKEYGPIRVRLTEGERFWLVLKLLAIENDILLWHDDDENLSEIEQVLKYGPTGFRLRQLRRIDRDIARDLLAKLDFPNSLSMYESSLRYEVEGSASADS